MGEKNKRFFKKLLDTLKGVAPTLVAAAGTAVGGPAAGGILATLMREITGKGEDADLDAVAEQILGSPELRIRLEELAIQREKNEQEAELRELELEAKAQEVVNATMQAEAKAEDPWTRRWRPYFGYVAGTAFGLQIAAVAYLMVTGGDPELINAVVDLTPVWTPALAVLGITSWGRSKEKEARIRTVGGN